jgi:GTP-binding protein EngB required for normal cell division
MKSDPDTEMSPSASSITSDVKTESIMGKLENPRRSPFFWQNFENEDQRDRVDIKQQAVCDALRLGDTIASKLRKLQNENQGIEIPELAYWVKKFGLSQQSQPGPLQSLIIFLDNVKNEHQTHRGPVVGFLGVLGAGKTSSINALLDKEELLASSSDRAATSVICELAYNHDSPGYRAEISFRTQPSLVDELDKFFDELKWKAQIEAQIETLEGNPDDNDPNGSEIEGLNQLIVEIQENLRGTIDLITEIWGIDQDDLRSMSTQELLETKPYGVEHLGTTRFISGTDQEEFAEELSSYLKSSSEDDTGLGLPPWPLIAKVTVYVKSPILKYGLRLRDLPGLCDTSEARSDIARKNSKDLDITVIVTSAIRATEESTAINLIKGQQKIQMQMDGKFNKGSFCVVASKIDDIKSESYLKQLKAAKSNKSIQSQLSRRKELDAAFGRANSRKLQSKQQIPGQPSLVSGANAELEANQREAAAIKDWLEHAAVFMRTQDITQRLQDKFQPRHRDTTLTGNTEAHDEAVEVFGISNKAYWMSKQPDGVKAPGFPDENHSGIPRLRQWLFESSFTARENHLDAILCKLWGLLIDIQDLAGLESGDSQKATESDAEELQRIHDCFIQVRKMTTPPPRSHMT